MLYTENRMNTEFSSETTKARRQENYIFEVV